MRIDQPAALAQPLDARPPARRATRRVAGFAMPHEPDAAAGASCEATPGAAAASAATCLTALAGGEEPPAAAAGGMADGVACRHGQALLGALAGLQAAAFGEDGVQARHTLADLARAWPAAANPGLNDVLLAIAQRAAIELARSE